MVGMVTLLLFDTPGVQPEKLSEGKAVDIKEESGCDRKDEAIPQEMMPVKNYIKGTLRGVSQR